MVPAAPHELRKISNNVCSRNVLDAFMATRCICNVLVGFHCTSCTSDMIQNNSVALTMFRRPSGLKHDKKTINGWFCKTIMSLYLQRANPNTWRRRGTPIPSYTTPKKTYISFNDFLKKRFGQHPLLGLRGSVATTISTKKNYAATIDNHALPRHTQSNTERLLEIKDTSHDE